MTRPAPDWIDEYIALELAVQGPMLELCAASCSVCKTPCCREVFCRESRESAFLRLVVARAEASGYRADVGWLGAEGCRLAFGRPPVCYEFLCQRILDGLEDDVARRAALRLGKIIPDVGRQALGRAHLVELEEDKLSLIDEDIMRERIASARERLQSMM